ncbi:MAG: 23S rRNA (guanosine(2251)-2'-O)-methyltransferase RlmB, partial [Alphaproteobacteria bacterium]|nr:23S rRNA (guanosine(2251)-2'-O)-methyltransferase RlmB [Alphaproteobacteria bacterium]
MKKQKKQNNRDDLWICGKHPVLTALKRKRRKIFEVLATRNSILEVENEVRAKLVSGEVISNLVGQGQLHQGLAARVSRLPIQNQNELLAELEASKTLPTLLLLDQISDPHNVGAIIRSAASFGVKKIIFCEHNAPKENATIIKSSAGTIEFVDLVMVTNFSNLIEKLKKIGYWCIGLAGDGKAKIGEIHDYKNIALVVGSEGNGIRELVKKNCDLLVKIEID